MAGLPLEKARSNGASFTPGPGVGRPRRGVIPSPAHGPSSGADLLVVRGHGGRVHDPDQDVPVNHERSPSGHSTGPFRDTQVTDFHTTSKFLTKITAVTSGRPIARGGVDAPGGASPQLGPRDAGTGVSWSSAPRRSGVPSAAVASPALAGPRSTYATPTAPTAPITGPSR